MPITTRLRRYRAVAAAAATTIMLVALLVLLSGATTQAAVEAGRPSAPLVPERGTLLGVYLDVGGNFTDAEIRAGLLEHEAEIGRRVDIAHDFQPFNHTINVNRLKWYHANGRIPMATWNGAPYWEILSGGNDAWIRSQAERFKQVNAPVFLRFFHEVDARKGIAWGYEANPGKYEEVWRYIHDIFDEVGADNVVWVYAPTAWGFETGEADLYYPGDDVVDWIGSDGYLYIPCRPDDYETFESVYEASIDFAAAHDKPLMAAEWGVGGAGNDSHKVDFFKSVVQAAEDNPELAAIVYFDKSTGPDGCNWSIDTTSASLAAYVQLAQHPHFNQLEAPTSPLCDGFAPTHWGTAGADVLRGTSGRDVIVGKAGADTIYGKGGGDLICANAGNDIVYGAGGADVVFGGSGKDKLYGGDRGDTLSGGGGNDRLYGGGGDDMVRGAAGDDRLYGKAGNDTLRGSGGADGLHGGPGRNDACHGGPANGDYVIAGCEVVGSVP